MHTGKHNDFYWIESTEMELGDFIKSFGKCLNDKYIAIAAFDGGSIKPNSDELALGWYGKDKILYTSKISDISALPYEQYDEWYVFNKPTEIKIDEIIVNAHPTLRNPSFRLKEIEPTWDSSMIEAGIEYELSIQSKLWNRVDKLQPEMVLIDSNVFLFITKNHVLFEEIKDKLQMK